MIACKKSAGHPAAQARKGENAVNSGKRGSINTVLSILLMVACVSMLIFGVILVRAKLLQNTQDLGMSLAES